MAEVKANTSGDVSLMVVFIVVTLASIATYLLYYVPKSKKDILIEAHVQDILSQPDWVQLVQQKARAMGWSFEEALYRSAVNSLKEQGVI